MDVSNKRQVVLFTQDDIAKKVSELGGIIKSDYEGKNLLIVSLLKGSFIFASDLVRCIDMPLAVEFMTTSSYGHGFETTNVVTIVKDVDKDLSEYDVLIVDDIIDSGITMEYVVNHLNEKGAKSIKTCAFLDKPSRRKNNMTVDYNGYVVDDVFIVGYGLNYGDHYRNVPYIFAFED